MRNSSYIVIIALCLALLALGALLLLSQCNQSVPSPDDSQPSEEKRRISRTGNPSEATKADSQNRGEENGTGSSGSGTSNSGGTGNGTDAGSKPGGSSPGSGSGAAKGGTGANSGGNPSGSNGAAGGQGSGSSGRSPSGGNGSSGGDSSRPGSNAGSSSSTGGTSSGGPFVLPGQPQQGVPLPSEKVASGAIYYEGRWVEGAIAQRRMELLARRAYAEATAHAKSLYGESTELTPFADARTSVATLESNDTFIVTAGLVSASAKAPATLIIEVRRDKAGNWSVPAVK